MRPCGAWEGWFGWLMAAAIDPSAFSTTLLMELAMYDDGGKVRTKARDGRTVQATGSAWIGLDLPLRAGGAPSPLCLG